MKKSTLLELDPIAQSHLKNWLEGNYDAETKAQLADWLAKDPAGLQDAFFRTLAFGTGGLRGIMGLGSNRINAYTVRAASQAVANYINLQTTDKRHAVVIGYDSRHQSRFFAEETARVFAGNGIQVYLSEELRPTPWVSFACRHLQCSAAIVITASHNPSCYNGYKVYWADGGQILPPHDKNIVAQYNAITDPSQVKRAEALSTPLIQQLSTEVDQAYLQAMLSYQNDPKQNAQYGKDLKIVFSSLHGTGITLMPQILKSWHFSTMTTVSVQDVPDGDFPSVRSPNPENREALSMGVKQLMRDRADILIATDPDADRLGVAVMHRNEVHYLSGNQIAVLCLNHICEVLSSHDQLPAHAAFVKTIGTTELFKEIAEAYQRPCFNVLTGFKYIAEQIERWETESGGKKFLFGGEESFGYLCGTHVRDKDAIQSGALICEVALRAKLQGKTLVDQLHDLFAKFGVYHEELLSLDFEESKAGHEQMVNNMKALRAQMPSEIAGIPVVSVEDYLARTKTCVLNQTTEKITLPQSDVLLYWLADESKVMVRPSGTEPKVKFYVGVVNRSKVPVEQAIQECQQRIRRILESAHSLVA